MKCPSIDLSVVIPVYRSEATLKAITERITNTCLELERTWEIVFVDDNSPDSSWTVLEELQQQNPHHVVAAQLMRNFGQHNAIMCGFHIARGRLVITLDDDLQNPPEEIPRLIAMIENENLDLVYGNPPYQKQHSWFRNLGSLVINRCGQFIFKTKVRISPYRIIRRELITHILSYDLNYTFLDGLLMWHTQRIGEIDVAHHPRTMGRSGYSLARLFSLAMTMLTNFSLIPLQIASFLGLSFACAGLFLGCYYLIVTMAGGITVSGYASLIVAVLCLGGIQLLCLGIIGEYVGRLHLNVNRKPQFTIRSILSHPSADGLVSIIPDN